MSSQEDKLNEQTKRVIEYYRRAAEKYDEKYDTPYMKFIYNPITWRYIEPYLPPQGLVLDAGGGTGKWTIPIAKRGLRVVLYDISREMLEVARRKIRAEGLEDLVEIRQGDVCKIDYPDETFDFVLAEGDPISYCSNPLKAVSEIYRVLKHGCYAVAGVDSLYAVIRRILYHEQDVDKALRVLEEGRFYAKKWGFYCWAFTPKSLKKLFTRCGFEVVKIVGKPVLFLYALEPLLQDEEKARKILELDLRVCEDESIVGFGGHLHIVARKI